MALTDEELDRMTRNLKDAFNDISGAYEYNKRNGGYHMTPERLKLMENMAAISQAYLAASKEQEERAARSAEDQNRKLPKLSRPANP